MRQMVLVGFLQAQNCTTLASSWRHPESRIDFTGPEYFQRIAQVLEAGKFQLAFFDDRLAMPDMYGGDHVHTVEYGIRCVKMDPLAVLMTMGAVTTRLGLGATGSTTYYEPFDLARRFQTVDLMLKGRAAWNVVTSVNDGEAMNMGRAVHEAHDLRYDRADEFMEIVLGHWHAWDDDALVVDKESGLFARGDKVHRLDHVGRFLSFARAVHRAALAAGPSGGNPGGIIGSRQAVRGAVGGDCVRGLSRAGAGQGAVCRDEAGNCRRGTRSGQGDAEHHRISGRCRNESRS